MKKDIYEFYTIHYINVLEFICIFVQNLRTKFAIFYRKTDRIKV